MRRCCPNTVAVVVVWGVATVIRVVGVRDAALVDAVGVPGVTRPWHR